jgi:hypothetical protein
MDKVNKSSWVAVNNDLELTEHESKESGMKTDPFILFDEKVGVWFNNSFSNPEYSAELYNKDGNKVNEVILNKWRISGFYISGGYPRVSINFVVIDPHGISEKRCFGDNRPGLIAAFLFLKKASTYPGWSEFKNADPIEREKSEIHLLRQQIEHLKTERNYLQDQLNKIKEIIFENNKL